MSDNAFEALGLTVTERIAAAMQADGIAAPTAIQKDAVPAALAGKHVLMHSGTGTGKTLAYLLPLLQLLRENEGRAAVFAPGAELAMHPASSCWTTCIALTTRRCACSCT